MGFNANPGKNVILGLVPRIHVFDPA